MAMRPSRDGQYIKFRGKQIELTRAVVSTETGSQINTRLANAMNDNRAHIAVHVFRQTPPVWVTRLGPSAPLPGWWEPLVPIPGGIV